MKKFLLGIALLGLSGSVAQATSFNVKLHDHCVYMVDRYMNHKSHSDGRYDEEAHGYTLGVISGLKDAIPASQKSRIAGASLGALSNYVCKKVLQTKSSEPFVFKYRRTALNAMRKKK